MHGDPCHRIICPPPATILFHQLQYPQVPLGTGRSLAWSMCVLFSLSCWLQLVGQIGIGRFPFPPEAFPDPSEQFFNGIACVRVKVAFSLSSQSWHDTEFAV